MIGSNAQVGVAVASFFPRIGLSALYGAQSPNMITCRQQLQHLEYRWRPGGSRSSRVDRSSKPIYAQQALWEGTIAQYKQTIIVAFREVSDALDCTNDAGRPARSTQNARCMLLARSSGLSLLRYNAGRASYFEVLEAEQLLFPAEDALAQTQRDQLLVVVSLYKALGGGWNLSDAQWTQTH